MKTRIEKARVNVRNKEGVLTPYGGLIPTESFGAKTPYDDTQLQLPEGYNVLSPKAMREAKKIERQQGPEIKKLNVILENPNTTPLAKRTAQRRLVNLKAAYDPILMADAANRGGINDVNPDGSINAWVGAAVGAAGGILKDSGIGKSLNPFTMASSIYNIGMGLFSKVDTLNPETFQNPYESQSRSLMANRRFNADPMMEANRTGAASAAYNIRNSGMGGGALAANMLGAQNARMRGDMSAMAQKQQADNQYMQEQAVMDATLGQQRADRNLQINQINAEAKAAKRQMLSAGLGQMGQAVQVGQQMANQKSRDTDLMGMYKGWMDMFSPGKKVGPTPAMPTWAQGVGPEFGMIDQALRNSAARFAQ